MTPTAGDRMLLMLAALASPHRLRIVERLHLGGRNYVSNAYAMQRKDWAA